MDPDVIVVGGGVVQAGAPFWDPLVAAVEAHVLRPVAVERALNGSHSALAGALEIARSAAGGNA